MDNKYLL